MHFNSPWKYSILSAFCREGTTISAIIFFFFFPCETYWLENRLKTTLGNAGHAPHLTGSICVSADSKTPNAFQIFWKTKKRNKKYCTITLILQSLLSAAAVLLLGKSHLLFIILGPYTAQKKGKAVIHLKDETLHKNKSALLKLFWRKGEEGWSMIVALMKK